MANDPKSPAPASAPAASTIAAVKEKKPLDPKAQARIDARKKAKANVLQFIKDNATNLGTITDDIKLLIGTGATRAVGAVKSINSDLRDTLLADYKGAKVGLSEMDIFKSFKIGRPEMVTKIRILVLCPNPADRVWVKFDEVKEVYNVVGLGATPPTGWDGYIPSDKTL